MMGSSYSYRLYRDKDGRKRNHTQYTREELMEMTTFHLRNICYKEKLVEGIVYKLDREGLIRTILKSLGREDHLLIDRFQKGGFERVQEALDRYLRTPLAVEDNIHLPAKLTIYKGLKLDRRERYRVQVSAGLSESNVFIVNDRMELCGILNLKRDGVGKLGDYVLSTEGEVELKETNNHHYSCLFFRKPDSDYLYKTYYGEGALPPTNLSYYKVPIGELTIRELEQTEAVLAIDFGTSNTTAGAYLDSKYVSQPSDHDVMTGRIRLNAINYVSFPEMRGKDEWIELLPTVVAVTSCQNPANIKYSFGFEALKEMRKNGYSSQATVFHGLKRWVNDYRKEEEIIDSQGNMAKVSRKELLQSYLLYIIHTAEHQFKCRFKNIHISSPVKLRTQFLDMFKEILPMYNLEVEHALDEGMAVLYNTIANQIDKQHFFDGEEYKALVIDCGGGTTDLSSCRFRISDDRMTYRIDIQTTFENGETNFGGNNITYRMFQFIKIVFADYYSSGKKIPDIDSLIETPGADLYRYVDEFGVDSVYQTFEERFRLAEERIPTKFKLYENRNREDYQRVRNNFYFLWEIAETMKKEFFRKTGVLRNRIQSEGNDDHDNDLKVTAVDRWFLSIWENNRFKDVYDYPDVIFTIREINQLIKGDIYEIVRKFLEDFYEEGKLQHYSIIKLTGQSCRIDMFREALKEFVPGRSIEFRQKSEKQGKVPDLKLACLRGAIRYLSDQKFGKIEATITNDAPITPYSVSAYTHAQQEKILISSLERMNVVRGAISRPFGVREVEFFLRGSEGDVRQKYLYTNEPTRYQPVLYEDIFAVYGAKIPQDETDSIGNGEVKFFVFADENNWGFHVVPIARNDEQLYWNEKQYFAFENDLSELDFFDGMK